MRGVLIDTASPGSHGSMIRYAELITLALNSCEDVIRFSYVPLAYSVSQLAKYPTAIRNWVHHSKVYLTSRQLRQTNADIFHILDGSHAYVASSIPAGKLIVTAHDVIPALQMAGKLSGPSLGTGARWLIQRSISALDKASAIVAVSKNTASDVYQICHIDQARIHVVPPALNPIWTSNFSKTSERLPKDTNYILHIGNDSFYKNREGVLRIFAKVRRKVPVRLVMAGTPPDYSLRRLEKQLDLNGSIEYVSDPTDNKLAGLYRNARLLLFPSLYEGFGWPPVEAMALGCPVVCSTNGSLKAVVGDAALTAEAIDETSLSEYCIKILKDNKLAEELIVKGKQRASLFTMEDMRRGLFSVYEHVLERKMEPVI